jgi:hypothetical protein
LSYASIGWKTVRRKRLCTIEAGSFELPPP